MEELNAKSEFRILAFGHPVCAVRREVMLSVLGQAYTHLVQRAAYRGDTCDVLMKHHVLALRRRRAQGAPDLAGFGIRQDVQGRAQAGL